jgi:hypothetical protein
MMAILDDSAFPLIRLSFSPDIRDEDLETAVADTAGVFARDQRVVFIIDISGVSLAVPAARRHHLHLLMETIQQDADRLMLAAIYVADTAVGRGVVTTLNWMRGKRPYPVRVVATEEEAMKFARTLL